MMEIIIGDDQRDAIAEIVNIGMGRAGDSLARLFDRFIQLSVPRIRIVAPESILGTIETLVGPGVPVTAVRQAFSNRIRGEALALFPGSDLDALADLVQYPGASAEEVLFDISNILIGACIGSVVAQFSLEVGFSPPSLLGHFDRMENLLQTAHLPWRNALLAEVNFRIEARPFHCHLLTFWPDESMDIILRRVDAFLASLC